MAQAGQRILEKMLERLYAGLANGPLMNCRPHASRQRIDLTQLARLDGPRPHDLLAHLLGDARQAKYVMRPDQDPADGAQAIWSKLRTIAEDAKTYEQDTGVQALFVGYPLLQLPPDPQRIGARYGTKRILAPVAFVPVQLVLKATRPPSLTIEATADGADRVVPNVALFAWVQKVTDRKVADVGADEEGAAPWREIADLVAALCEALEIPQRFESELNGVVPSALGVTPRADDDSSKQAAILFSSVLGLFPTANQGLLRDLEALADGEPIREPLQSFLKVGADLGIAPGRNASEALATAVASERCVTWADPCQLRAVRIARKSAGVVIHGPPGTGKSQTITNIIADHLANGERVLFVCDKRTALDVVHHRLDHLGLGSLCAVVHDARRDQRELYRAVREQLDGLADARTNPRSAAELYTADAELRKLHEELSRHAAAVSHRPGDGTEPSFHELVGHWFSLDVPDEFGNGGEIGGLTVDQIPTFERNVREAFTRGTACSYSTNPWTAALGTDLRSFLARSASKVRESLEELGKHAERVDQSPRPGVPLHPEVDLVAQSCALRELASALRVVVDRGCHAELAHWCNEDSSALKEAGTELKKVEPLAAVLAAEPLDPELAAIVVDVPKLPELAVWTSRLATFLQSARKWYSFLLFGRKRAALSVIERFGLTLSADTAARVSVFLQHLRTRVMLHRWVTALRGSANDRLLPDASLSAAVADHVAIFRALALAREDSRLQHVRGWLRGALSSSDPRELILALDQAAERADAAQAFSNVLVAADLISAQKRAAFTAAACAGEPVYPEVGALAQRQGTIEHVLRIRDLLRDFPRQLAVAVERLLDLAADEDCGWRAVQKAMVAGAIAARLAADPVLLSADAERLRASYDRYRKLEELRRQLALDLVLHTFASRQRQRLLASTGTRLNTLGADVRRRLVSRGERALRLRQVISAGASIEGGDPLFDLRPVWMASPEVVAQVMPRLPVFDIVIFDEASQCRLEESLPVLTRAKRVVIAGDPKQLPPTRFFESSVTESQQTEAEDEQELFEDRQADSEDLLTAALNLSIEQAYLDVHYRSSNADLIAFSNEQFYDSRLQPIPAHPKNFTKLPPLRLVHAGGVYDKRTNHREARQVLAVVRELLARPEPPSIGIACFNLTQRDCILEVLNDAASEDPEFEARYAAARNRRGAASHEGLFVKNLENVQGDERDHIIISTTYGPDPKGKFYRRFGPLGQAGGGRRLNVLVTRARQQVHIITSIPASEYRTVVAVPAGKQPSGALLLFGYLQYAEWLEKAYAEAETRRDAVAELREPESRVFEVPIPSQLAVAVGQHLQQRFGISNDVHWGNDGFSVDAALRHPVNPLDVTIGVLCDGTRFTRAPDPVQWDIFRVGVLESQGWKFARLWSPHLFRDPDGSLLAVRDEVEKVLDANSDAPSSVPVASLEPLN